MKKMKFVFGLLAIAAFGLTSCNNDDENNNVDNSNGIAGTYELKEFRTPTETDINRDNTPHANQADETDCYDNSKLKFNADNTFSYDYRSVTVSEGIATCASATYNGTWEVTSSNGDNVNIAATYKNSSDETVNVTFVKTGNRLVQTSLLARYPDVRNNVLVYSVGTVVLVFEK